MVDTRSPGIGRPRQEDRCHDHHPQLPSEFKARPGYVRASVKTEQAPTKQSILY